MVAESTQMVVAASAATFCLQTVGGEDLEGPAVGANTLVDFDPAVDGTFASIHTGAQETDVRVTVASRPTRPHTDLAGWDDVVEFSLVSPSGLALSELEGDTVPITSDRGALRVRVSAVGRAEARRLQDVSDEPTHEAFRIEIWPEEPGPSSVIAGCGPLESPAPDISSLPEYTAGMAGARSIGRDLDARRQLSGEISDIEVERVVTGVAKELFPSFAFSTGWSGNPMVGGSSRVGGTRWVVSLDPEDEEGNRLTGTDGFIELRTLRVRPPTAAVSEWAWCVSPTPGRRSTFTEGVPFLALTTELETGLAPTAARDDKPMLTARVAHRRVPVEWHEALTAHWRLHLAIIAATCAHRAS